ncbi:hypothetical protein PR202_gb14992 [Eleusine coracana subsp. coracana]|uniref:Uncharacterized protein n=1 Tax=Eleusine coracana subsp. coracana TaxID=191504 RepID=A0AAV5EY93_ELECO|nr:hypothetical protein PR202_gb14992 [Eleusine coracana subsp. coracana]
MASNINKLTNTIQKRLKVSSTQLLYQSAPYQAAILFATGPFVDQLLTNRSVFAHKYSAPVLGFIILSCLIAVSVNFSTFLVIGTTSPVTYQMPDKEAEPLLATKDNNDTKKANGLSHD